MFDVIIVGAGFSGICIAASLKRAGCDNFVVLDRADDVGGTWRDNTYPGAACDIASHLYSFSFRPNYYWSNVYARQPEILAYLQAVVKDEGIRDNIRFNANVSGVHWEENRKVWRAETNAGPYFARALVIASGHLSDASFPEIKGLADYHGTVFHSAQWDHNCELSGKRIGIIGTGASAIQIVPELTKVAKGLVVFQRSAPYVVPRRDREYSNAEKRMFERLPHLAKNLRNELFWFNEDRFLQRRREPHFLQMVTEIARTHLKAQVADPELRRKLTPDYEIGCKRILLSNDYYPALQKPGVLLETTGIELFDENGVVCTDGTRHELDAVVMATGFEATDLPITNVIYGKDDRCLADDWATGPRALNCTAVSGYPNLFMMLGPNTGLGAGSMVYMIETQAAYIMQALDYILSNGCVIEPDAQAEAEYVSDLHARSEGTVWLAGGCKSWYIHQPSGRLTALWPDFMHRFREENGTFSPAGYLVHAQQGHRDRAPSWSGRSAG